MALLKSPLTMVWVALLLLLSICSVVAKDKPDIDSTSFEHPPVGLQYFEDSESVLVLEERAGVLWRSKNAGKSWHKADGVERGVASFWLHPTDNKKAYALSRGRKHWVTTDQGESWRSFELLDRGAAPSSSRFALSFHAGNSAKVIFNAEICEGIFMCEEVAYYTLDDFKDMKNLEKSTRGCVFAHGTLEFVPTKQDSDDDRVLCIMRGKESPWPSDNMLLVSDDFFKNAKEPRLEEGRVVRGMISMAVVKGYLVAAAKSEGTAELALYVTVDAEKWHRALFPQEHKVEEHAYTILESTNYSIQMDVMITLPINPMGILFSSNSNGTYFTENVRHTNRNYEGIVDFEKIQNIQGIVMVNVVDNSNEVERNMRAPKRIKSMISFDDGRTWSDLKVDGKSDRLQVHSVTDMRNSGKIFSSPAPGLVMAVGNTGDYLRPYNEGDLYISDDAGLTWTKTLSEAHKYEFGDQGGIVVAIGDEGLADKVDYSLNHGQDWKSVDLDAPLDAKILTTVPDSTSRKFILEATRRNRKERKMEYLIYALDFDGLNERKCGDGDFEDWPARKNKDGEASCIMGHKQVFRRRKKDADCFIGKDFDEALPKAEPCTCSAGDFECDFNFVPEGEGADKKCVPAAPIKPSNADDCKDKSSKFMGPSGWRLIPGDDCKREGGEEKDKEIERPCSDAAKAPPKSGKIEVEVTPFKADRFGQKVYLERSGTSHGQDETIIMSTIRNDAVDKIYKTKDQGKTWEPILEKVDNIKYILKHEYENDAVYFLTGSKEVWYSVNRGDTFGKFDVPHRMETDITPLNFHHDFKDYMIWIGAANCDPDDKEYEERGGCHMVASYSTDRGTEWKTLVRYCEKCEFIRKTGKTRTDSDHLIYCETHKEEKPHNPLELRSSENWWAESKQEVDDILTFVTMSEFIIVAQKDTDSNLKVQASVDAQTFADAHFPPNFNVPHKTAYTVLDSSTHAIFLHVTVGAKPDFEYGRIMKSNSNGTSYVLSINAVNRNREGYVDFEKMQGLEGVALVNVVDNLEEETTSNKKKLKSKITHNDGSQWALLKAPSTDVDGHNWPCDPNNIEECSLHLHSYTERSDPHDTFSSSSAVGLMMGVGNVGKYLGWKGDDDVYTFITRDAGINWDAVKKGNYMWEYGDQGSIIVIVEENAETDVGYYTLDEGRNWTAFKFSDKKVKISDLTTVPSDGSKSFVIWAKSGPEVMTINVDFSGLRDRECVLDENSGTDDEGDFRLWAPSHPLQPDGYCLFGHVTKYHRKKIEADCWIGNNFISLHDKDFQKNCSCTRQDFECDYNYELQNENSCALVPGLEELDPARVCAANPNLIAYHEHRGYRKIPISTCTGGEEEKLLGPWRACPGHSLDEDPNYRRLSGFGFFVLVVLLPIAVAGLVGWQVYRRFEGSFGRIRLGESVNSGSGMGRLLQSDRPWIQYPVMAVSALVAVAVAIPMLVGAAGRAVGGWFGGGRRYTTRQSFAQGRGQYAIVDPDEDELLGNDDEDADGV